MAPLLAALGAYDCRWPPYASHVAFELWSRPPDSSNPSHGDGRRTERLRRVALEDGGGGGGEAKGKVSGDVETETGAGDAGHGTSEEDAAYVRLTFNGQPVTHFITDCRDLSDAER